MKKQGRVLVVKFLKYRGLLAFSLLAFLGEGIISLSAANNPTLHYRENLKNLMSKRDFAVSKGFTLEFDSLSKQAEGIINQIEQDLLLHSSLTANKSDKNSLKLAAKISQITFENMANLQSIFTDMDKFVKISAGELKEGFFKRPTARESEMVSRVQVRANAPRRKRATDHAYPKTFRDKENTSNAHPKPFTPHTLDDELTK
jgi:hypothetical protein